MVPHDEQHGIFKHASLAQALQELYESFISGRYHVEIIMSYVGYECETKLLAV